MRRRATPDAVAAAESGVMPGFGNDLGIKAPPEALPHRRNAPQRCACGLDAEQFSGSAVTAPRRANERGRPCRIRPSVRRIPDFAPVDAVAFARPDPSISLP